MLILQGLDNIDISEVNSMTKGMIDIIKRYYFMKPIWFLFLIFITVAFVVYIFRYYNFVASNKEGSKKAGDLDDKGTLDETKNSTDPVVEDSKEVAGVKSKRNEVDGQTKLNKARRRFMIYLSVFLIYTFLSISSTNAVIIKKFEVYEDDVQETLEEEVEKYVKENEKPIREELEEEIKKNYENKINDLEKKIEENKEEKSDKESKPKSDKNKESNFSGLSSSEKKELNSYMDRLVSDFSEELGDTLDIKAELDPEGEDLRFIQVSIYVVDEKLKLEIADNIVNGLYKETFSFFENSLEILSKSYYDNIPVKNVNLSVDFRNPVNEENIIFYTFNGIVMESLFVTE